MSAVVLPGNEIIASWDVDAGCDIEFLCSRLKGATGGYLNVVIRNETVFLVRADRYISADEAGNILSSVLREVVLGTTEAPTIYPQIQPPDCPNCDKAMEWVPRPGAWNWYCFDCELGMD